MAFKFETANERWRWYSNEEEVAPEPRAIDKQMIDLFFNEVKAILASPVFSDEQKEEKIAKLRMNPAFAGLRESVKDAIVDAASAPVIGGPASEQPATKPFGDKEHTWERSEGGHWDLRPNDDLN